MLLYSPIYIILYYQLTDEYIEVMLPLWSFYFMNFQHNLIDQAKAMSLNIIIVVRPALKPSEILRFVTTTLDLMQKRFRPPLIRFQKNVNWSRLHHTEIRILHAVAVWWACNSLRDDNTTGTTDLQLGGGGMCRIIICTYISYIKYIYYVNVHRCRLRITVYLLVAG